ncbi:MAG: protein kinase [Polyangiaceae bacterium]
MTTNPLGDGTLRPPPLPPAPDKKSPDRKGEAADAKGAGAPLVPDPNPAQGEGRGADQKALPTHRELLGLRPVVLPPRPDFGIGLRDLGRDLADAAAKKARPRRARAVEAEADLWAALDSGPPSIPSAANVHDAAPAVHESRPTSPSGIAVGQTLADRYDVLSVLGEGGMGIVYHCRDTYVGDDVAVKRVIIPDGPLANEYVMWFYKESRALATLDHPSIVRARDFGQLPDGSPYLVMDMASGASLHELSHTKMSFPLVWSIVSQMLGALAHAHARGIIHGDLKPSNVLVEELEGEPPRVKILDFGLAWLKQNRHDERLDGTKALEFAPHAGAGTPGYMAPEQIQHESHNVCGATNLYSLGCILYRMLSGKAPFSGDSKELLRHHAFDMPPVPKVQIEAPNEVAHFVMRLLAKHPWDRWEFASEARAEWDCWRPSAAVSADPAVWRFPPLPRRKGQSAPPPKQSPRRESVFRLPPGVAIERAPGLLSIRQSPLVGRHDIRSLLRDACDEVVEGRGMLHRLVILTGPAGVGKSRIAEWLYEAVHEEGTLVPLRARYRPLRGPLDGMMGAVTQYFNFERADRDTIERTLLARWKIGRNDKAGRTWVAGVAEWLRPLGPISDQPIGPSGIRFTLDTPETRRMVIRYTLRRIARGRPLLLWLDDLHHASDTTIEGLMRLLEEEPDQRIVMVATIRTEDYAIDPRIAERLEPLKNVVGTDIIEVRPMDNETTCTLLRAALPLADDAVEEAARRSRGNPLFALQQLHAWALAGELEHFQGRYRVPPDVLAVQPRTTAELWDSRIAALPAEHRLAAFAAASLGGDIRRAVLHALLTALELPADSAMLSLQNAEILGAPWPRSLQLAARVAARTSHTATASNRRRAPDLASRFRGAYPPPTRGHPSNRSPTRRQSARRGRSGRGFALALRFPAECRRRRARAAHAALRFGFAQGQTPGSYPRTQAPLASRGASPTRKRRGSSHSRRNRPFDLRGTRRSRESRARPQIARTHRRRTWSTERGIVPRRTSARAVRRAEQYLRARSMRGCRSRNPLLARRYPHGQGHGGEWPEPFCVPWTTPRTRSVSPLARIDRADRRQFGARAKANRRGAQRVRARRSSPRDCSSRLGDSANRVSALQLL